MNISAWMLDLLFPRTCVGCSTTDTVACVDCWKQWESPWVEHQPVPGVDQLLSFGPYKAVFIQKLIQRWKFEGDTTSAVSLSTLLSPSLTQWLNNTAATLVPIPLHERKWRERGFNQTEDLAQALTQYMGISWLPLLQRTVYTKAQKSVEEEYKQTNVQNAFQVDTRLLPQVDRTQSLIILDDICTTGSTLSAAALALRQAGFINIAAVVVARG